MSIDEKGIALKFELILVHLDDDIRSVVSTYFDFYLNFYNSNLIDGIDNYPEYIMKNIARSLGIKMVFEDSEDNALYYAALINESYEGKETVDFLRELVRACNDLCGVFLYKIKNNLLEESSGANGVIKREIYTMAIDGNMSMALEYIDDTLKIGKGSLSGIFGTSAQQAFDWFKKLPTDNKDLIGIAAVYMALKYLADKQSKSTIKRFLRSVVIDDLTLYGYLAKVFEDCYYSQDELDGYVCAYKALSLGLK